MWSTKRKRGISKIQVYKWKAKLNIYVVQQEYGVNYFNTYSPVVTWFSIINLLTFTVINNWHSRKVDFVLAYPQAPIKYDLYMEFPKGFQTKEGNGRTHILQLLKNLYGQ